MNHLIVRLHFLRLVSLSDRRRKIALGKISPAQRQLSLKMIRVFL